MKVKKMRRRVCALAVAMTMISGSAYAGIFAVSVVDKANLLVNEANLLVNEANKIANVANAASSLVQIVQLEEIRRQLSDNTKGTVTYNLEFNTTIDNDFTWIINPGGGDEIIPIPFKAKLDEVMNNQNTEQYTSHYKTIEGYEKAPLGHYGDEAALEASRARKAANVALVEAIVTDEQALTADAENVGKVLDLAKKAEGHGKQLQVANALAASEVNQLMKLRGMMLATESVRAAEAQAVADRDARAVAVGRHLRDGLDKALEQSIMPARSY